MVDVALKEQLQRSIEAIRGEMAEARERPVSRKVMDFFYYGEGNPRPALPSKWPDSWSTMLLDTVELRYYRASRALQLVEFGLDPVRHDFGIQSTVKAQPSGLGILLIFTFYDMLAVVSGGLAFDAMFIPEPYAELTRAYGDPKRAVFDWRAWRAKQDAAGRIDYLDGVGPSPMAQPAESAKSKFKRLQNALYPSQTLRDAARERWKNRKLTPIEVQAMVRKLSGEPEPEQPPIEEQVLFMDLDKMAPIAALEALQRLQAQARSNTP